MALANPTQITGFAIHMYFQPMIQNQKARSNYPKMPAEISCNLQIIDLQL